MKRTTQIPATFHSREIDPFAYQIVKILQRSGFTSYLVGGCVRDILLGKNPKDFDIATNASPQQVRRNINHSFIIGRRFRIVLVKRGDSQYEVTTFRRDARPDENLEELPEGDNLFGTPEEDARRRDFTINALFYDPMTQQLIDYAEGLKDLESGIVRMIGDPNVRLVEDPIRIMRGIRLAHMIRFSMDADLREAIRIHSPNLATTALPRRREEFLKFLRLENPAQAFLTAMDLGVLPHLSPELTALMESSCAETFLRYLENFREFNLKTPQDLFSGFMVAIYFATANASEDKPKTPKEFFDQEPMVKLMRDQLGLFKSEQIYLLKTMQLMGHLQNRKEFERRGPRRRQVILQTEAFPLALNLAEKEGWLSSEDVLFWQSEWELVKNSLPLRTPNSGSRRRPRRRRPRQHSDRPKTAKPGQ